jgi:tetratricopeptide (TPR) repeat protein
MYKYIVLSICLLYSVRIGGTYANEDHDSLPVSLATVQQLSDAIDYITESITASPNDPAHYVERGNVYRERWARGLGELLAAGKNVYDGDYHRAIADYSEAIRRNPTLSFAYADRGALYYEGGEAELAIIDESKAIQLNPSLVGAYTNRGFAYKYQREFDKALADFDDAVRLDPAFADAYFGRGMTYKEVRQYRKAIDDLGAAVRLEPNASYLYEERAAILLLVGDCDAGIADLRAASRYTARDPTTGFESSPKAPLTTDALRHGRAQVGRMLHDRPAMAQFGEESEVLNRWAERKFAGEDLRKPIFWDPSQPKSCLSQTLNREPSGARVIQMRSRGMSGEELSFERLWSLAVFELYNAAHEASFIRISRDAAAGRISKQLFAAKMIESESTALYETRSFYINVYLPWVKERHITSHAEYWYIGNSSAYGANRILCCADPRKSYWKEYERQFDTIIANSTVGKRNNEPSAVEVTYNRSGSVDGVASQFLEIGTACENPNSQNHPACGCFIRVKPRRRFSNARYLRLRG